MIIVAIWAVGITALGFAPSLLLGLTCLPMVGVVDMVSRMLHWLLRVMASLVRVNAWTLPGFLLALGNRDKLPDSTALAGRAQRTATNTLENFVLFAAVALVAQAAGLGTNARLTLGAEIFFWARLVYIPVYLVGIAYLRTGVWFVSIIRLEMMVATVLA